MTSLPAENENKAYTMDLCINMGLRSSCSRETKGVTYGKHHVGEIPERLDPSPMPPFLASRTFCRYLSAAELLRKPPACSAIAQLHIREPCGDDRDECSIETDQDPWDSIKPSTMSVIVDLSVWLAEILKERHEPTNVTTTHPSPSSPKVARARYRYPTSPGTLLIRTENELGSFGKFFDRRSRS